MATGMFRRKSGPENAGSVGGTKPVVVGVSGDEEDGCSGCGVDVGAGSVVVVVVVVVVVLQVVVVSMVVGSTGAVVLSAVPSWFPPSGRGFSLDNV